MTDIPSAKIPRILITIMPDGKPQVELMDMDGPDALLALAPVLHDLVKRVCEARGFGKRPATAWESMALMTTQATVLPVMQMVKEAPPAPSKLWTPKAAH